MNNEKFKEEEILGFISFLPVFLIFLLFNVTCFKINRSNTDNILLSHALKRRGKVLFVFNLIAVVITIICITAISAAALTIGDADFKKSMLPIYLSFILAYFLSGVTAVINSVFFKKAIKINGLLVNDFINDIGQQE